MILFISFFTIFANLYLGFLVFLRNPKNATHFLFVLFTVFVALWSITNYFSLSGDTPAEALLRIRIVLSVAVLMFSILYFFSVNFPSRNWRLPPLHFGIMASFSLSIIILVFTPLVFKGIAIENGVITPIPNFGLFFYSLSILGLPIASSIVLFKKFRSAQGKEREQLKFLVWGIIITFILTTVTNFLLVNIFKFTNLVVLGPFFTLIFVAFSTYAILRHQLMDIKVILTEALVSFIGFVLLVDVFVSQGIYQRFLRGGMFLLFFFFAYLLVKSVLNEIKRREELEILTLELEKLDKAKSEFLSIASHQLRTPLTAIRGYASMVLENSYGKILQKTKVPIKNILTSSERLLKLVNDLLNLSRIESGKVEIKFSETSLDELISGIIYELEVKAKEKGLYVKLKDGLKPLPKLTLDQDKIRQAILNLIDNAIKYTDKGGVMIELNNENGKLKILVSDTGAGIEKEEIGRLFESFSRGAAGNKFWANGSGLGLYVAKKFVEINGGRIWAESPGRGKGSNFYIELPIK